MISIEEINLWLMSNRMCVLPVAKWDSVASRLDELESERLVHLRAFSLRASNKSVKAGKLVEENKLLKKNLKRSKMKLGRLKTGEVKRLLSLLARQRNWNSNTQAQTP